MIIILREPLTRLPYEVWTVRTTWLTTMVSVHIKRTRIGIVGNAFDCGRRIRTIDETVAVKIVTVGYEEAGSVLNINNRFILVVFLMHEAESFNFLYDV